MLRSQAIGRLVRDPELNYTSNGTPVCNFTLACERPYKNGEGERDVDFIKVVTWRKSAENNAQHLEKGLLVGAQGRIQIRKTENDGRTYRNIELHADNVKYLEYKNDNNNSGNSEENYDNSDKFDEEDDFDVPF